MRTITKSELYEILEKHKKWLANEPGGERAYLHVADLSRANLRGADLRGADLSGADLSYANLLGANLDYSCLPLRCGILLAHFDDRQLAQIAYHLVRAGLQSKNASDETKAELRKLIGFANKFHRVNECGYIEEAKESE